MHAPANCQLLHSRSTQNQSVRVLHGTPKREAFDEHIRTRGQLWICCQAGCMGKGPDQAARLLRTKLGTTMLHLPQPCLADLQSIAGAAPSSTLQGVRKELCGLPPALLLALPPPRRP